MRVQDFHSLDCAHTKRKDNKGTKHDRMFCTLIILLQYIKSS